MINKKIVLLYLVTVLPLVLNAQVFNNDDSRFEFNAGISGSVTVMGNPSQIANQLALDEGYLTQVSNEKGLPLGINGFMNMTYSLTRRQSVGVEFSMGWNNDGGSADVKIGSVVPNYVMDSVIDAGGTQGTVDLMNVIYSQLNGGNTMKGQYIDPKIRAIYKVRGVRWNTQVGVGASFLIPFAYFALPSKNPNNYSINGVPITDGAANYPGAIGNIFGHYGMWGFRPVSVPFPLRTSDGRHYMKTINTLADFSLRTGYGISYFEMSYSTDFHKIHNLKILLGVQMQSGKNNFDKFDTSAS